MEMGKLTAKLRDAVPVCLLVEGKEIKRYKNIEIPDELKKLEYQDFKFDVPMTGVITFKIIFEPGVLPEEFPQMRARRTRTLKDAPVALISETPAIESCNEADTIEVVSMKASNEATQETKAFIIIEGAPKVEIPESTALLEVIEELTASPVEGQTTEKATPEVKTETEIMDTTPAKKVKAKDKNALAAKVQ